MEDILESPGLNHLFVEIVRNLDPKSMDTCRILCSKSAMVISESKPFYVAQLKQALKSAKYFSKKHFDSFSFFENVKCTVLEECFGKVPPQFMTKSEKKQLKSIFRHFTEELKLRELKLIFQCMKTYFDGNYIQKFDDGEVRFLHPILWAIKSDQVDLLTLFGRIGVDFNIKDRIGKTPLHYACLHGKQVIFDYLIEHGKINVDALDHYERTALHYACKNGQLAMVQYLVAQTGDIFKRDKSNWNALHWAARFGKEDVVEFLLNNGADPLINSESNIF